MNYSEFLNEVIDKGIAAAKEDYKDGKQNYLEGSIAGFEACRDKSPEELREIYFETHGYINQAYGDAEKYWWFRCYQLEVEWVCNCVSAILLNMDKPPILSWLPTCNGMQLASKILNS